MTKAIIITNRFYDFDCNEYQIGGVETYVRNLCEVFRREGLETHVLFTGTRGINKELNGVHLHVLASDGKKMVTELLSLAERMGDPEHDLLVFGTSTLVASTSYRRSIAIQHGIYWDTEDFHVRGCARPKAALALRALQGYRQLKNHSRVGTMVCVDLNYVNWMRSLSVSNRLPYRYIPNFSVLPEDLPPRTYSGVRMVFARRFERIRGCDLLMRAMPDVLERHPEVTLTIAGGGSMASELHEVFDDYSQVTFTRYDATKSVMFHAGFDIALVPSVGSEGTSLSLLEAMAAGCAVVATDVGGMSNIVLNGHNGLLIRPDAGELRYALSSLIEDAKLRSKLALGARATVRDSFSRSLWEARWKQVIRESLGLVDKDGACEAPRDAG